MKKLLSILTIAILGIGVAFAQTTVPVKKVTTVKKTVPVTVKKETKKVVTISTPTKKDGTADMRYKANKNAKKAVVGPTKKDGTADMRYKANKQAVKKSKP